MNVSSFRGIPFWAQVTLAVLATAGTLVLEYLSREGELDASSDEADKDSNKTSKRRRTRKNRSSRVVD